MAIFTIPLNETKRRYIASEPLDMIKKDPQVVTLTNCEQPVLNKQGKPAARKEKRMKTISAMAVASGLYFASSIVLADLNASSGETFTLANIGESEQVSAEFGYSLSASGKTLLIGAPKRTVNGKTAGAVYQIKIENGNLSHDAVTKFYQGKEEGGWDIYGAPENGDRFGHVVVGLNDSQFFVGVPG